MPDLHAHQQVTQLLSSIPYFANVDIATLETIAHSAIRQSYEAGQVALMEGQSSIGFLVVQEGWLKAVKISPEGREQVLRVVGPGDVFNAIGVLSGATNQGTVIALEPATVWIIQREILPELLEKHPPLAWTIIQTLAERVQRLMEQVEDLSLRTVEVRLARLLTEEAADETVYRRRWDTQAEMAARLGTVPNVLHRALRRLEADGLIKVERRQIHILDRDRLEAIADFDM